MKRKSFSNCRRKVYDLTGVEGILRTLQLLASHEAAEATTRLEVQDRTSKTIETALWDVDFFDQSPPPQGRFPERTLYVLFGSERGLCGRFNEAVIRALRQKSESSGCFRALAVGSRLIEDLGSDPRIEGRFEGAESCQEVPAIAKDLLTSLAAYEGWRWIFLYQDGLSLDATCRYPMETVKKRVASPVARPVRIRSSVSDLRHLLLQRKLSSILQETLYVSLHSENKERVRHLRQALQEIEKERDLLWLQMGSRHRKEFLDGIEALMIGPSLEKGNGRV